MERDFTDVGPPDCSASQLSELIQKANELKDWIISPLADELGWKLRVGALRSSWDVLSARRLVREPLKALIDSALRLGMGEVPEMDADKNSAKNSALSIVNRIADWAETKAPREGKKSTPKSPEESDPVNWNDYRYGRKQSGDLLTVEFCNERFNLSGPKLSLAAKDDPSIRRKNPDGRGYVYRYDAVIDLNTRKE